MALFDNIQELQLLCIEKKLLFFMYAFGGVQDEKDNFKLKNKKTQKDEV